MIGCICGGVVELIATGVVILMSALFGWATSWYNHHKMCRACKHNKCGGDKSDG